MKRDNFLLIAILFLAIVLAFSKCKSYIVVDNFSKQGCQHWETERPQKFSRQVITLDFEYLAPVQPHDRLVYKLAANSTTEVLKYVNGAYAATLKINCTDYMEGNYTKSQRLTLVTNDDYFSDVVIYEKTYLNGQCFNESAVVGEAYYPRCFKNFLYKTNARIGYDASTSMISIDPRYAEDDVECKSDDRVFEYYRRTAVNCTQNMEGILGASVYYIKNATDFGKKRPNIELSPNFNNDFILYTEYSDSGCTQKKKTLVYEPGFQYFGGMYTISGQVILQEYGGIKKYYEMDKCVVEPSVTYSYTRVTKKWIRDSFDVKMNTVTQVGPQTYVNNEQGYSGCYKGEDSYFKKMQCDDYKILETPFTDPNCQNRADFSTMAYPVGKLFAHNNKLRFALCLGQFYLPENATVYPEPYKVVGPAIDPAQPLSEYRNLVKLRFLDKNCTKDTLFGPGKVYPMNLQFTNPESGQTLTARKLFENQIVTVAGTSTITERIALEACTPLPPKFMNDKPSSFIGILADDFKIYEKYVAKLRRFTSKEKCLRGMNEPMYQDTEGFDYYPSCFKDNNNYFIGIVCDEKNGTVVATFGYADQTCTQKLAGFENMTQTLNLSNCDNIMNDNNVNYNTLITCVQKPNLNQCFGVQNTDPTTCNGRGKCVGYNNCTCNEGYAGEMCQYPVCYGIPSNDPMTCSGKGVCQSPNICSCISGAQGAKCESYTCFGMQPNDPMVCSGNGKCVGVNNCTCSNSTTYWGQICQYTTCQGTVSTDVNVCSGHGYCEKYNTCRCNKGYTMGDCSAFSCFGKHYNDTEACNGNGICIGPDRCKCPPRFDKSFDCGSGAASIAFGVGKLLLVTIIAWAFLF